MDIRVPPRPEPDREPSDPHEPPLDDEEDVKYLGPYDHRRLAIENRREESDEVF